MVYAYHPQRLFYCQPNGPDVVNQEKAVSIAAAMTGMHFIPNYYKLKLWPIVRSSSKKRYFKAVLGTLMEASTMQPDIGISIKLVLVGSRLIRTRIVTRS